MQVDTTTNPPSKGFLRRALDAILIPFLAILTAVVLGGIIIASVRGNPFLAYYGLVQGSFGSAKALSETAVWATPYIFAGLAVALAFKGGLFNIGAEGQLALGATLSALIGYALPDWLGFDLPAIIHLPLTIIVGMAGGAFWASPSGGTGHYTELNCTYQDGSQKTFPNEEVGIKGLAASFSAAAVCGGVGVLLFMILAGFAGAWLVKPRSTPG